MDIKEYNMMEFQQNINIMWFTMTFQDRIRGKGKSKHDKFQHYQAN